MYDTCSLYTSKLPIPWKKLLLCPGLWACAIMHLGVGWVFYILNAALSTIPYVAAGIFGLICSPALDFFTTRGYISRMNGFRILLAIVRSIVRKNRSTPLGPIALSGTVKFVIRKNRSTPLGPIALSGTVKFVVRKNRSNPTVTDCSVRDR
uniref:Uncharacterized protein n=1 Tax=Timema tahoe TaxID=61484 RepID=A0A7R9IQC5_9NEOP|nr:unnamed protein product [Timema tahoe]